jgi:DNA-binding transcriptional LysR family regulator
MRYILPLKYVDAIARTKSIRAAAENLSITPSALNRRILAMEDELGVEIFERSAQGVKLNSAGEIFIQHARNQLADLERVRSRIADLKGMRLGHVRIAATHETASSFLPTEIQRYRADFPGVTFEISVMPAELAENALIEQTADIAIIFEPKRISEFHSLILSRQELVCLVAPHHKLAKKKSIGLMECLEWPLLLPQRGNGIREVLETATAIKRLGIVPTIESNSPQLLTHIARQGNGIAFTTPLAMDQNVKDTSLVAIPLDGKDVPGGMLFVGQLRLRTLPVAAAKFVEEMRKVLER